MAKSEAIEKVEKKQELGSPLDFTQHAGQGLEDVGMGDLATPFLSILEALSPQVNKKKDAYIEGAEVGRILNVATQELYDEMDLIVAYKEKYIVEWVPRDAGGGFVALHPYNPELLKGCKRDDRNNMVNVEGNHMVETQYYFCLQLNEDHTDGEFVLLSMSKSRLKSARILNGLIKKKIPDHPQKAEYPSFAHIIKVTTENIERNGTDYHIWSPSYKGLVQNQYVFDKANQLYTEAFNKIIQVGPPPTDELPVVEGENTAF